MRNLNIICQFIAIALMSFMPWKLLAQPFDTLLLEFRSIQSIYPLDDGTFILIGNGDSTIRVSRINGNAETLWYNNLVEGTKYVHRENEIHLNENDSSIQIITVKYFCDYAPDDTSLVFTLDLKGQILDVLAIPFSYPRIFLLSGNPQWPRCATLLGDSIILHFTSDSTSILEIVHPPNFYVTPIQVDMCPSGNIVALLNYGYARVFQLSGNQYIAVSEIWAPGIMSRDLICIEDDKVIVVNQHEILLVDTLGSVYSFGSPDIHFFGARWSKPFLYPNTYSATINDSFYVLDNQLRLIYSEEIFFEGHYTNEIAIKNNTSFRVGSDKSYPLGGFLESEHHETHQGPQYFDVEFIGFEIGEPDSAKSSFGCGYYTTVYYYSRMTVTIENNSNKLISQLDVYYQGCGHCGRGFEWVKTLYDLDLSPGEVKDFFVPDVTLVHWLEGYYDQCISILRPDLHSDDDPGDNYLCIEIKATDIGNSDYPFIRLNPNPVSDYLYVHSPVIIEFDIRIYDMNGVLVLTESNPHGTIDIRDLTSGMYIVQYVLPEGEIFLDKFIKV